MAFKRLVYLMFYFATGVFLVFFITDFPLRLSSDKNFAAIAIRDNVSNLEKNGSLVFTQAFLNKKYLRSICMTQNSHSDKKDLFRDSLTCLLKTYSNVDVYFLAHHNNYYRLFRGIDSNLLSRIHMVYNTGCGNADDYQVYKDVGADIYIGHQGRQSLSPIFYFYFLRRICTKTGFETATNSANEKLLSLLKCISMDKQIKEHEGILF